MSLASGQSRAVPTAGPLFKLFPCPECHPPPTCQPPSPGQCQLIFVNFLSSRVISLKFFQVDLMTPHPVPTTPCPEPTAIVVIVCHCCTLSCRALSPIEL